MKMPELRSGPRRGRAQPNPVVQSERRGATGAARRRRPATRGRQAAEEIVVVEPKEEVGLPEGVGEIGALGGGEEENQEEVGERRMDEFDSGGKSADKLAGGEDEGSTAPLPEKVSSFASLISFICRHIYFLINSVINGLDTILS